MAKRGAEKQLTQDNVEDDDREQASSPARCSPCTPEPERSPAPSPARRMATASLPRHQSKPSLVASEPAMPVCSGVLLARTHRSLSEVAVTGSEACPSEPAPERQQEQR